MILFFQFLFFDIFITLNFQGEDNTVRLDVASKRTAELLRQ